MSGIESLLDVVDEINAQSVYLKQAANTLDLLEEVLIEDGIQTEDSFNKADAINFVRCFPAFLSILSLINREIQRASSDLADLANASKGLTR